MHAIKPPTPSKEGLIKVHALNLFFSHIAYEGFEGSVMYERLRQKVEKCVNPITCKAFNACFGGFEGLRYQACNS
jgi:hypothetical protein